MTLRRPATDAELLDLIGLWHYEVMDDYDGDMGDERYLAALEDIKGSAEIVVIERHNAATNMISKMLIVAPFNREPFELDIYEWIPDASGDEILTDVESSLDESAL